MTVKGRFDERQVGEVWYSAYWNKRYTVIETCSDCIKVEWADGETTVHATALRAGDKRISAAPIPVPGVSPGAKAIECPAYLLNEAGSAATVRHVIDFPRSDWHRVSVRYSPAAGMPETLAGERVVMFKALVASGQRKGKYIGLLLRESDGAFHGVRPFAFPS